MTGNARTFILMAAILFLVAVSARVLGTKELPSAR